MCLNEPLGRVRATYRRRITYRPRISPEINPGIVRSARDAPPDSPRTPPWSERGGHEHAIVSKCQVPRLPCMPSQVGRTGHPRSTWSPTHIGQQCIPVRINKEYQRNTIASPLRCRRGMGETPKAAGRRLRATPESRARRYSPWGDVDRESPGGAIFRAHQRFRSRPAAFLLTPGSRPRPARRRRSRRVPSATASCCRTTGQGAGGSPFRSRAPSAG